MRTILRSLVPIALVLAVAGCKEEKARNEKSVVILFTTDEHSNLFASSPELDDFLGVTNEASLRGGVERRMTILKAQRDAATAAGKATLTLSSGDFSQGSLVSAAWIATAPELATMKDMGYDAVALGNHEFDLADTGLANMVGTAVQRGTPIPQLVLSNLDTTKAAALAPLYGAGNKIAPYTILSTSNGLRIGIVSSMGVGAGTVAGAAPAYSFWSDSTAAQCTNPTSSACTQAKFLSVLGRVQAQVDAVRAQGVDAVILLGHGGIGDHSRSPAYGEDELMALQLKGVDLVLSGHSHLFTPHVEIMYGSGTAVPLVQAKAYGQNVGKVELVFRDDGSAPRPFLAPDATQFFEVTSDVAKSTDNILKTDLYSRTLGFLEYGIDQSPAPTIPSFLESTLTKIVGQTVNADPDPAKLGTLWNFPLGTGLPNGCTLTFDVTEQAAGESNAMNLDTDAIRYAAGATTTEIAVQAFGPVRGGLLKGSTGQIGFADVYHMAPLGADPVVAASPPSATDSPVVQQQFLNGLPGYPLVRFNVPTVMLRIVYEATLQIALAQTGDFFLGASGLTVHYDPTRPLFNTGAVNPADPRTLVAPGWVTYMALSDGTVLYDTSSTDANWIQAGFFNPAVGLTSLRSIGTTYYVASFASSFGIPLYNDLGQQYGKQPYTDPTSAGPLVNAILVSNGSHVKDYEAIGRYVRQLCTDNNGTLPAEYGAAVPRRVCMGACP